ncbi:YesL family protein [Aquibacillus salsiterrae]|uniref:DUF624 domain-containing protein n=1 Tax=Aquibacillus salsiterrae TaxID=2950439 RepID=A0A9X3WCM5_9BACI|nr:DUF624 domain-containing protein [Aquibacillus salsiterrae]MDC3415926.1 DUF624 domain-containing protein [Aquibacillus salsiterrae]
MARVTTIGGLYRLLEWLMWICYINLLWIAASLIGLLFLGIFPATVATFTVIRNLLLKDSTKGIFSLFIKTYKQEFLKANATGYILLLIGYILYLDFLFIGNVSGILFYALQTALLFISVVYLITFLYIIPVYVHFQLKFFQYFKQAALIGIFSPVMTIIMAVCLVVLYYILLWIPGLIPFVTMGVASFIIMGIALFVFNKLETKQQDLQTPKS